jgi:tetratricopeptide (TPR) repeat protein
VPKRYFNWKLAIVLVIAFIVLGVTAFGLRRWRKNHRAHQGLEAGIKAYNQQNWEQAAKNLGSYLAVEPVDVQILLKYAETQLNRRPLNQANIRQAASAYRKVLGIDKKNSKAAIQLAGMYLEMGMAGEAELIVIRALKTNPSPQLRRILAVAFANQRKFKEAATELKNIIKEHPDQILAYDILGRLIDRRPEDFSQAQQYWLDEAVKNNPSAAEAYIIRAAYHLRCNRRTEALANLTQAEKKDLSDSSVRLRLAEQFINADILDRAQKHLEAVQASEPASQLLWQIWAQLALKSNSKTIMLEVAETGLKELSSQPWDFMLIAVELYIRCGQLDSAADCITRLHQKDIAPATTAFLEGLIADREGRIYEAVKYWRHAIQLGNKSPRIQLALALALARSGDVQSALRQLQTLVFERPDLFRGHLAFAKLLAKTGDWAKMAEHARIAMQISPDSLDATLLHIQARIQLLVERQTSKDSTAWQDIQRHLTGLQNADNVALDVGLLQFQLAMYQSDFAGAEALVTELRKAHPALIKVAMAEIELLNATGNIDTALVKLQNIIEKFPSFAEPVEYLATLLVRQNKQEKAEGIIKDALVRIEQPLPERNLSILLADLYDRWGRQEDTCELLTLHAEKLPDDISVKRRLLRCKRVIKNPVKAQQLVNEIKAIEGELGWQWRCEQARIWLTKDVFEKRYPQIVALLKENLLANPDDQNSRMLLATAYEKAGQLQLAVSTYNDALDRSPRDIRIIAPAVTALYKANEYDHADEILQRADNEKVFHPQLRKLELQSHLRRGELSPAADILEDLLTTDPDNQSICLSLALLKIRQKRFTEANQLLNRLQIQEPNALPVTVAQIQLNIHQHNSEEALRLCNELISNLNNASAYILRARTLASFGQSDKAAEDFEYATTIEPHNVEAWVACSNFYYSIGRLDKAVTSITRAMSLEPDNLRIYKHAVPIFLAAGDRNTVCEGKNILDKALKSNPQDNQLCLFKARLLLAEATVPDVEQAAGILREITEDQPKISEAWVMLGEISLRKEQLGKAMDIALRGLAHTPNDKMLLLLKARAEAASSPALAIPTLKALRESEPSDTDVVVYLADTYLLADQPQKAINLLTEQIDSCGNIPEKRRVTIALAVALHKSGNEQKSQEIFDSLYHSAPDDPAPLLAQARLLKDDRLCSQFGQKVVNWYQNHTEDIHTPIKIANDLAAGQSSQAKKTAEDLLHRVLHHDPDSIPAMNALAMLLQMTGRFAESAALYRQILILRPDNLIAINNLAWILCEEQGQHQQALQLAQRGLQKAPDYADLIDTRGVAYYRLGEFNKALQDFNQCINLYPARTPSIVVSYFHLGRTLMSLGQKGEAVENLKKTLELNTKIGSLSVADFAEAQHLLKELSQGV